MWYIVSKGEKMLKDCPLIHEKGDSGAVLDISIEDFNALGFEYGDSVDISFSNGYSMEDVPYYNGYYVEAYQPLLVAYPEASHVKLTSNYGEDIWITAGLSEGDTASVSIRCRAKYLEIQKSCDIRYSDEREDFPSDEVFANFRNISAGRLGDKVLYRSASPCDNRHGRAACTDGLAEDAGIRCILNLADDEEKIGRYIAKDDFDSPYFLDLYKNGGVLPMSMSMNYLSDDFTESLAEGLTEMAGREGPYLVHCTEGKDRTGLICLILGALCGASCDELEEDYMITYDNYYGINRESDPDRYDRIIRKNFDVMLDAVIAGGSGDARSMDPEAGAERYLLGIGMDRDTIDRLKGRLEMGKR